MSVPKTLVLNGIVYRSAHSPWDLAPLMYVGGAGKSRNEGAKLFSQGKLSRSSPGRVSFVTKIHEYIDTRLECGGSEFTAITTMQCVLRFFRWADANGRNLDLESVSETYRAWCDDLLLRHRLGKIRERTAYSIAHEIGCMLDEIFESPPRTFVKKARLSIVLSKRPSTANTTSKENLEKTFAFGHVLVDIAKGLTVDAIWGELPVKIPLREGLVAQFSGGLQQASLRETGKSKRALLPGDVQSLKRRRSIVNARVAPHGHLWSTYVTRSSMPEFKGCYRCLGGWRR